MPWSGGRYRASVRKKKTASDDAPLATWPIRPFAGYRRLSGRSADLTGNNAPAAFGADSRHAVAVAAHKADPLPAPSMIRPEEESCYRGPTWRAPGRPISAPPAQWRSQLGSPPSVYLKGWSALQV